MMSKLNFVTILLIGFVNYLGLGLVYPVFASLLFDPTYSIVPDGSTAALRGAMLGILISLTPLTQFFCSPILGAISDRKGRKRTLIFGIFIGLMGYLLAVAGIWMQSLSMLFLYRIFVGISEGTVCVAQAMIADISEEKNKARRFAIFNACLGIGFTIGPFMGGKLADPTISSWSGYALPFMAAAAMCSVNLLMISLKFPETHQKVSTETYNLAEGLENLFKVFQLNQLKWLFFATFAFSFGWSFFNEFIPVYLRENFGFTLSDVGNYYAYGGAWYALSAGIATAPLLKYFKPERIVVKALWACAACMLIFLVIEESYHIWWVLPPLMYWLSATFPMTAAIISNQAGNENQGEVLGVYQSVIACGMGISPLLIGSAIGAYPAITAWGGALAMIIASVAFWKGCHPKNINIKNINMM